MKRILLPLLSATILLAFTLPLDKDYWLEFIKDRLTEYVNIYPQQKVYIQLDADEYEIGNTIYFKAFVLNDTENIPEDRSKNLYIELLSPTKKVFMNRLLKIDNGIAMGDFPVHDTIRTGMYQLRAYTRNMKNYGEEFLFKKNIRINNPEKVYYSKIFHKNAKKANKNKEDIDLQFFPEGGDLVSNIKQNLAFKAINQTGTSSEIKGVIKDKKKITVAEFSSSHKGMGKIEFTPVYGNSYTAEVVASSGKKFKFDLPEVLEKGYNIKVNNSNSQIALNITTNKEFSGDPVAKTVYLFIQSGGKLFHSQKYMFEDKEIKLNIDTKKYPSGIYHITLFNGQGKPQCERLFFVNQYDNLKISPINISGVKKKEKIELDIEIKDNNQPKQTNLSIAVRKKAQTGIITGKGRNIKNHMLLLSDLKGYIENPEYYFGNSTECKQNMDLLMLTHGWRKFIWEDILKDSIDKPEYELEKDLRVTGRITKYFFDISVKEASVKMTMLNKFNDVYKTRSVDKGKFEFIGLEYSDTLDVLIEARTKWGRKNILIIPDEDPELTTNFNPLSGFYLDSLLVKRKPEYKKYKEPKQPEEEMEGKLHGRPDQIIYFENDPSITSNMSVIDALRGRVPGLSASGNSVSMRGISSGVSNQPLFLIDGVRASYDAVQSIPVSDVQRVEILKGPSAAIYGLGSAGGVIAVYTKQGFRYKRGEIRFKMLGYHTPKKFYSPKYTPDNKTSSTDLRKTIYWNPNIVTDKDGKARVNFYHSDITGDFEIIIEGMSNDGKFGYYSTEYSVKDYN